MLDRRESVEDIHVRVRTKSRDHADRAAGLVHPEPVAIEEAVVARAYVAERRGDLVVEGLIEAVQHAGASALVRSDAHEGDEFVDRKGWQAVLRQSTDAQRSEVARTGCFIDSHTHQMLAMEVGEHSRIGSNRTSEGCERS